MATTTSSPSVHTPVLTYQERWQMIGGERLYTLVRWLVLLALAAIVYLVFEEREFWPVSSETDPLILLLYGYAGVCLLMSLVLFIPPLHGLLIVSYFTDVLLISLLMLLSGEESAVFFPLYLFPLVGITISFGALIGSLSGLLTAFLYVAAVLIGGYLRNDELPTLQPFQYVTLGLAALVLVLLPAVMGSLMAQQGEVNRRKVKQSQTEVSQAWNDAQVARGQMQTLFAVAAALTSTLRGEQILEALFSEGQQLIPYTAGLALLPTSKRGELSVSAGHGLALVDAGSIVRVQQGSNISAALYPPADPQLIEDISQEPDLQHLNTLQECRAACLVPLRAGVQVFGLIIVARQDSAPFSSDELNILNALASYATVALVNQELANEVRKERINMATAEDHARHWLAREIHDNLAQKLAAITMNIDFLKRMLQEDPSGANAELDKIGDLFKRANFDVRTLLGELKPTTLETEGLPAALEEYLKRLRTRYEEIQILFEAKGVSGLSLDKEAKSTLFNIVQESVNNSLKYAEPKHIWVRMERAGYRLTITIQDDGKGFNVEESKAKARARGSHGLSNLEDRARMIDGVTEIVSAPGKGSTVKVTVPLEV